MTDSIVFGGGCFWCTEAVFKMFNGVVKTTPGYAGGHTKNPTYEDVCSGETGHAEVLRVDYDPKVAPLEKLLEIFFTSHDPTSVNQQGADIGSQYRSIILYSDDAQKKVILDYIKRIAPNFKKPVATEVKRLDAFYESEDYHKDYYKNNPLQPYCMFVIRPKVGKIKKEFGLK
ncbi:MAG: peptide-methionine (S)-S-oxide reductase MsrA [Candidatus Micrarchaeota archaeon]|nr:peptide-methionine (S)-S-oxide reductase MsrA [Candidatus Micrarchaeota archaeon]